MENKLKKHILTLYLFSILTMILALCSLNRLWYLHYGKFIFNLDLGWFRLLVLEHMLTGFYVPFFWLFCSYTGMIISRFIKAKLFGLKYPYFLLKETEFKILIFGGILYFLIEYLWQFNVSYNTGWLGSWSQFIFGNAGIILCWIYFYFIHYKE